MLWAYPCTLAAKKVVRKMNRSDNWPPPDILSIMGNHTDSTLFVRYFEFSSMSPDFPESCVSQGLNCHSGNIFRQRINSLHIRSSNIPSDYNYMFFDSVFSSPELTSQAFLIDCCSSSLSLYVCLSTFSSSSPEPMEFGPNLTQSIIERFIEI